MIRPLVLLVEDNAMLAVAFETLLVDAGFCVVHAGTSHDAIHLINEKGDAVAAIVTDIQLGGDKTGWDVANHARMLKGAMPIVYMTGDSAEDWSARGVPDSVLLQKPFSDAQLTYALSTLLNIGHVGCT